MKNHGNHNSRIEILLGVIRNLLDDIANLIEDSQVFRGMVYRNVKIEIDRDYRYIASRVQHEGLPFLTVTLPRLGKWYDSILADHNEEIPDGFKPHHSLQAFSADKKLKVVLQPEMTCPLFCRTLMYVIHASRIQPLEYAGLVYPIIRAYRSLFYLFYKLEVPLGDALLSAALEKWRANEKEIQNFEFPAYYDDDLIITREILEIFFRRDKDIDDEHVFKQINPCHGPGAVAGGERDDEKWQDAVYIPSLHSVYPYYDLYYGFRSEGRISQALAGEIIRFQKKRRVGEAISRLLFVPKDSRGPRTISCEPKELMFIQQGVCKNLMKVLHERSRGRINFVDQSINGNLALASSLSGEFATVDLQDASDRVTTKLVRLLFPEWTLKYLIGLRSTKTLLPNGEEYLHYKYAPMGSAVCFPIESAIFWALAVTAGYQSGLSAADAMASTYVYGDDIIIRPEAFEYFTQLLSSLALKVNVGKSYVDGPFRESCGVDAWKGYNITPFKIKKDISRRSPNGPLATAICEYSSKCFALDLRKTGEYLFNLVDSVYPGVIRYYKGPYGCLSVVDPLAFDFNVETSWSTKTYTMQAKGWVLYVPNKPSHLLGLERLLKNHYGNWEEYDPATVANPRVAKIRKRNISVEI